MRWPPKGTPAKEVKPDDAAQSERFIEAAKALGLDKNDKAFKAVMRTLLKPKGKRGSS